MPPPSTENIRPRNSSRMKLTFLGTRGEIEARTRRHRMHSSLLVSYRGCNVMIDCGLDWLESFELLRPSAIVLTHAHPDHAWGLKNGAPCPVYAPKETWQSLKNCQVGNCHRRRAQSCREPPCDGRRAWRRNALRVRRDGAGSAIKQIRFENCDDFV